MYTYIQCAYKYMYVHIGHTHTHEHRQKERETDRESDAYTDMYMYAKESHLWVQVPSFSHLPADVPAWKPCQSKAQLIGILPTYQCVFLQFVSPGHQGAGTWDPAQKQPSSLVRTCWPEGAARYCYATLNSEGPTKRCG